MFWNLFDLGLDEIVTYHSRGALIFCTTLFYVLAFAIPYLLGSINSAVLISRVFYRDDIRNHGSGNAGLTNTLRTYGKKAALFVLLGDILKTVLAVFIGGLFVGMRYIGGFSLDWGGFLGAVGCILGHVYPIYYKFKGGKGVLCTATAILILSPMVFAVLFLVFVIMVGYTKYVSLGSTWAGASFPFATWYCFPNQPAVIVLGFLCGGLVVWMHRANIKRLLSGTESKFSLHKKKS